ncbi:MAG: ABC transporter substrate-binding protein [Burkholderiaceae bacterium]
MTFSLRKTLTAVAVGATMIGLAGGAAAKNGPGVTDKEIKIGNTMPYSGPASAYGTIGKAVAAYLQMINDNGGVNGRKINFVTLDDGYSPPKTVEQVRKLVEQEEVFALFNTLGTPTNSAIHKYMNSKKVPHLFLATGATKWGDPKHFPWTMGLQPNYQSEAKIYAMHILDTHPNAKIAVLYQNDDYGKDYLEGFKHGLGDKAKSMIVSEVSYEVTDPTIDSQMVTMKGSGADVFFNITTPKFAAQAIKKAAEIGWKPTHYLNNVSQSVGSVLKPAGLENSVGIISSVYLKDPTDPQWQKGKAWDDYKAWLDKYIPGADISNSFYVYGYNAAQVIVQTLKQCGDDLSRKNLMKQAASLDFEPPMLMPGINVKTSADDFYPIERMQLVKFDGKGWQLFGKVYGR